jgi:hypothetical protein
MICLPQHDLKHKEPEEGSQPKSRRPSQPPPHHSESDSPNSEEELEKFGEEFEKSLNEHKKPGEGAQPQSRRQSRSPPHDSKGDSLIFKPVSRPTLSQIDDSDQEAPKVCRRV